MSGPSFRFQKWYKLHKAQSLTDFPGSRTRIVGFHIQTDARDKARASSAIYLEIIKQAIPRTIRALEQSCGGLQRPAHENILELGDSGSGRVAQLGEHLLCKLDRAVSGFHSFLYIFNVFNKFGESASRSK
jgi:hypothetical protein